MNNDYWLKRWNENRVGFHRTGVNPLLDRFLPQVSPIPGRTLVPLCGKSEDLIWLSARGHEVVGVELSELAVHAFAREQRMEMKSTSEPPFVVVRGKGISIYVGDFFNFRAERSGRFDFIYDRAALIALPPAGRDVYVRQLKNLLAPGGKILLISIEYDPRKMEGPPFAIPETEVRSRFAGMHVERIHELDCLEEESHFKERGLDWMKEAVYVISL